jgi:hypothetical protein
MLKKWRAIRGQPARSRIWRSLPRAEDRKAWVRPCGGGGGVCRHVVFSVTDTHDCTPYCTETWKYRSTSCAKDVPTFTVAIRVLGENGLGQGAQFTKRSPDRRRLCGSPPRIHFTLGHDRYMGRWCRFPSRPLSPSGRTSRRPLPR